MTTKRDLTNRIAFLERQAIGLRNDADHWRRYAQRLAEETTPPPGDDDVAFLRDRVRSLASQLAAVEADRLSLIEALNAATTAERFGHVEGRPDGHPDVRATRPVVPNYTPRRTGFNPVDGSTR